MNHALEGAVSLIRRRWGKTPQLAVVLGSGLGQLASQIDREAVISYDRLPHFPRATAFGHQGQLVCGRLQGVPVAALSGRCHLYEGYTFDQVTLPVRLLAALGARWLVVSNASGGLNPQFRAGDLMLITDHLDLLGRRTAAGGKPANITAARIISRPVYDAGLIEMAAETARRENFVAHRGVYVAVTGPSYETRAEYRAFRRIGGDAVGMSTVPEVLAARQAGMRVLGISTITNVAKPDAPQRTDAQQVVDVAAQAEPKLRRIVERMAEITGGSAPTVGYASSDRMPQPVDS